MLITQLIGVSIQLYFNTAFLKIKLAPFIAHQLYALLFFLIAAFVSVTLTESIQTLWINLSVCAVFYTGLTIIALIIFPQIFALSRGEIKTFFSKKTKDTPVDV
jgi:hypothetical protein